MTTLSQQQQGVGIAVTLPDGDVRRFDRAVSGADIAADIGPGLAKAAIAVSAGTQSYLRCDRAAMWIRSGREPRVVAAGPLRDARCETVRRTSPEDGFDGTQSYE